MIEHATPGSAAELATDWATRPGVDGLVVFFNIHNDIEQVNKSS